MKGDKRTPLPEPIRPLGKTQRPPRPSPPRPLGQRFTPLLGAQILDEPLQRWFDEEVEALQRLAHTQRLKGDYVAAQSLEREIRTLASDMTSMIEAGGNT